MTKNLTLNPFGKKSRPKTIVPSMHPGMDTEASQSDIKFVGTSSRIQAATLEKLIEYMTHESGSCEKSFFRNFFLTYRSVVTSQQLLEKIIDRYMTRGPRGSEKDPVFLTKVRQPIRIKVLGLMKEWISKYMTEKTCLELQAPLQQFIEQKVRDFSLPSAENLLFLLRLKLEDKKTAQQGWKIATRRAKLQLCNVDPFEFAEQLTLIQSELFSAVTPFEWLGKNWLKNSFSSDWTSVNLVSLIDHTNKLSNWINAELSEKSDQFSSFSFFWSATKALLDIKNFHASYEILQILARWGRQNHAPEEEMQELEESLHLLTTKNNFKSYHATTNIFAPPILPPISLLLLELVSVEDIYPDFGDSLINFQKREELGQIISSIVSFQKQPFVFQEKTELNKFLQIQLDTSPLVQAGNSQQKAQTPPHRKTIIQTPP